MTISENRKNGLFQKADRLNAPLEVFLHTESNSSGGVLPHWHYYLEMIYILKGSLEAHCQETTYLLRPGDLVLFYPQSTHSMHRAPDCPSHEEVTYFVLLIDLNFLTVNSQFRSHFAKIFRIAYAQNPQYLSFSRHELQELPLLHLLTDCLEEMRNRSYAYHIIVCSNITLILAHLTRCLKRRGLDVDELIMEKNDDAPSIDNISKYIKQHCTENLKVQTLAQMCGMSYSYFSKQFRETYNQSCKEYIEFARISQVTSLLGSTTLDLNYISQETGFSDCSHLIRTFKKWKGVTPKQWRTNKVDRP